MPDQLYNNAVQLLQQLIAIPSLSRDEGKTAMAIVSFLQQQHVTTQRHLNNVWAVNKYFDPSKPSILLNSHHDTVKPSPQYTKNPFTPVIEDGKLYGLGSNDAGGCLVSLIATFLHFYDKENLQYNIVLAATAEEEISGANGIESLLSNDVFIEKTHCAFTPLSGGQGERSFAIVGEPTQMQLAIAEKGLMVVDAIAPGKTGHAARNEGENAIYNAMCDIQWIQQYAFPKTSEWLGNVKMTVTSIDTENKAHNVVPSSCSYVIDVRITDEYTHEAVLQTMCENMQSTLTPRSMRMRSSRIDITHPIVQAGIALGKKPYGSPTSSDKALMRIPALKCGPGDSARSHSADEFIFLEEIKDGIETYIKMIGNQQLL